MLLLPHPLNVTLTLSVHFSNFDSPLIHYCMFCPAGIRHIMYIQYDLLKVLKLKSIEIEIEAWFENWVVSCVPNRVVQPKWYKTEYHVKVGDVVLFTKNECNSPT